MKRPSRSQPGPDRRAFCARHTGHHVAQPWLRARIEERATGATASMLNIDRRTILDLDTPLPPRPTQCLVIDDVRAEHESLANLIAHTRDEIRRLKEPRAASIADAVLGRIDVRTAHAAGQDPKAITARHERGAGLVVVGLNSGLEITFKPQDAPGLPEAHPEQLADIEISPCG